jgi:hypothetical protein
MHGTVTIKVNKQGRVDVYTSLPDDYAALILTETGAAYLMADTYKRAFGSYEGLAEFKDVYLTLARNITEQACERLQSGDVQIKEDEEDGSKKQGQPPAALDSEGAAGGDFGVHGRS